MERRVTDALLYESDEVAIRRYNEPRGPLFRALTPAGATSQSDIVVRPSGCLSWRLRARADAGPVNDRPPSRRLDVPQAAISIAANMNDLSPAAFYTGWAESHGRVAPGRQAEPNRRK